MVQYRYSPLGAENELSESQMKRLGLESAFGPICIVSVDDLSESSLKAVTDLLTNGPGVLMDEGSPLVIELSDGLLLSDRAFWTLVSDTLDDSFERVSRFVRAVIEESQHGWMIPFDRYQGIVSEDAMYAYFDTRLWSTAQLYGDTPPMLFEYGELFLEWLRASDLLKEVRQQPYVERLLDLLRRVKDPTYLFDRLMHFRMRNGQYGLPESELFRLMTRRGFLRKLIDEEVAMVKGTTGPLGSQFNDNFHRRPSSAEQVPAFLEDVGSFLMEMVDLTYGNSTARNDVIDYVIREHGFDMQQAHDKLLPEHRLNVPVELRQWADEQPLRRVYDTGFHTVEGNDWVLDPKLAGSP